MRLGMHSADIFLFGAKLPNVQVGSAGVTLYSNFHLDSDLAQGKGNVPCPQPQDLV